MPFCRLRLTAPKLPRGDYPAEPKSLGEHIKKRRIDLGLLQRQVAKQLGVDKWTVLNWERGKTAPDVRYYPGIITFLGYNPLPTPRDTFPEQLKAARQAWKLLADREGVERRYWANEAGKWIEKG